MTNEEAIKILKTLIPKTCKMVDGRLKGGFDNTDCPEYSAIQIAVNALEKQIPKKPIIKYGDDTSTHNLGKLMCFHCPSCGKYIVAMYETDVERGGGIHNDLKGCSTCLQAIDFTGYYHIDKLDEEIDWR